MTQPCHHTSAVPARRVPIRFDTFVVALLGVAVLGALVPVAGETYDVLRVVSKVSIGLLFFLYGVRLSTAETVAGLTNWKLHVAILATTFVAFPLVARFVTFQPRQRLTDIPLYRPYADAR